MPKDILDTDNVVRYVGRANIQGQRVNASVFQRRPGERGVSVNLLDRDDNLSKTQKVARVKERIHLKIGRESVFAELNVGDIKQLLRDELPGINFVHTPSSGNSRFPYPDPTHSEILGLPPADDKNRSYIIADLIAKRVKALHPAYP